MNGFDYKKMADNFKVSETLKQQTINAVHSRMHKKLMITKRERIVRYSSAASLFAIVMVLFLVFDVGGTISLTARSIMGDASGSNGNGNGMAPVSTESSSEQKVKKATEASTEKATESSTSKETVKQTTLSTENKTKAFESSTTPQTNNTTSFSNMQTWNGSKTYTNYWEYLDPISTSNYNFISNNGTIQVKTLSASLTGNLIEAKVGASENCTIRMEVHPALFSNGLAISKSSDGIITFTNDTEGIILTENAVNYPKDPSESQTAYANRCISYLTECLSDPAKAHQGFSLNNFYTFNTKSSIVMTNSDSEWRACMKLNYTGNPIAALSKTTYGGFGYLTVVFDRASQCFIVQTYVAQAAVTNSLSSQMAYACYGLKYKVN